MSSGTQQASRGPPSTSYASRRSPSPFQSPLVSPGAKHSPSSSTASGEEVKAAPKAISRKKFHFSEPFSILIGEDEVHFMVHKDILCHESKFFRAACSREWIENQEKVIRMPESCPDTFRSFMQFAYRGEIVMMTTEELEADADGNDELLGLAKLAGLANFLQHLVLKNAIMDLIRTLFKSRGKKPPSTDFFCYVYEHEQSGSSKLRGFILDWFCTKPTGSWLGEHRDDLPERFVGDVAVKWAKADGDRTKLLDPEVFSLCYYHERESEFHPCPCGRKGTWQKAEG